MQNKIITLIVVLGVLGTALLSLGFFFSRETSISESKQVEAFNKIKVDVKGLNVKLVKGDDYSISYTLKGSEKLDEFKIKNNTLTFKTSVSFIFRPSTKHDLVITVPTDMLEVIELNSTSGDVTSEIKGTNVKLTSVSGDINANTSGLVQAKTTSGDINLSGDFKSINAKTTSGDISLAGSILEASEVKTTAGDISISLAKLNLDSSTTAGKVKILNQDALSNAAATLRAKTTAGNIIVK